MHPASDPVWFAAGITEGLLRGGVKAGAETAIENSVAKQLTFQTEHIMRHFVGTGLTEAEVIGGLRQSIQAALRGAASEGGFWGRVSIRGQLIEYRAYTLANGTFGLAQPIRGQNHEGTQPIPRFCRGRYRVQRIDRIRAQTRR
jgi:hypothetical protein